MLGFVHLFRRPSVLQGVADALSVHGYEIVRLDAGLWESHTAMYDALATGLSFPSYFGRNMNALNDCLSDVATGDYGWDSRSTGLLLILDRFDRFAKRTPE